MPTYEYECEGCGERFEVFQSMSDQPLTQCPQCGEKVKRLMGTGAGIIIKGSASGPSCGRSETCCGRETPCAVRPCDEG
jgi:putative FmdB family regulatory protein